MHADAEHRIGGLVRTETGAALAIERDDLALRDTHVLNPGWVTNGIYGLITNPDLLNQGGVLSLDDLASYRAEIRTPLCLDHRGLRIVTMPPASGGGVGVANMPSLPFFR